MTTEPLNAYSAMDIHSRLYEATQPPHSIDTIIERRALAQSLLISSYLNGNASDENNQLVKTIVEFTGKNNENRTEKEKALSQFLISEDGSLALMEFAVKLLYTESAQLKSAQTIFVSEQILDEVIEAAETMPDDVLIPQDVFVPNGVLIFEKPLDYEVKVDDNSFNELWKIKSVQFNVKNGGIHVRLYGSWYSTLSSGTNEKIYYDKETKSFGFDGVSDPKDLAIKMFGVSMAEESKNFQLLTRKATSDTGLADATFFSFNSETELIDDLSKLKRQLIALFRLTYSYLDVESHKPPRHFIKRAKRSGRQIPEDFYVSVLTLRHKNYEGGSGVKHASPKFAFRVRGHWAKRYLRSTGLPVGDPKAYRFVYISDYIKGKDKTLVESKRVIGIKN